MEDFSGRRATRKLLRLDISEVGYLEQRDVLHARQDHPELKNCNTSPTSTTIPPISSQVQQSITTFTSGGDISNRSHPNNVPAIEEISQKLDIFPTKYGKYLKLYPCTITGVDTKSLIV